MGGPLEGIRVMDLCAAAVGPWAAGLLGQLGAEVIKVEPPDTDRGRENLPLFNGVSPRYIGCNYTKRSIVLDLKTADDREIAYELARRSDIFTENFRRGVTERLGLDYETLSKLNPRLIYCSSSGWGERGPMREMAAANSPIQEFVGSDSLNGAPGTRFERNRQAGHYDFSTSIAFVQAILVGLYHREVTGKGQKVETSMLQANIASHRSRIAEYFATGVSPKPMGSARPGIVPDQAFKAQDTYITVSCLTQAHWHGLCKALGKPELAGDPRFSTNALRVEHREELVSILEATFSTRPSLWWLKVLRDAGVPAGPFLTFNEIVYNPQFLQNDLVREIEEPGLGVFKAPAPPWKFSRTPSRLTPGPIPGQHTNEVLQELGFGPRPQIPWEEFIKK